MDGACHFAFHFSRFALPQKQERRCKKFCLQMMLSRQFELSSAAAILAEDFLGTITQDAAIVQQVIKEQALASKELCKILAISIMVHAERYNNVIKTKVATQLDR